MYGYKLRNLVWGLFALVATTYLTFFAVVPDFGGKPPSWSQNATFALWFLLNFVLIAIAESFSQMAAHSSYRNTVMYKWFGVRIRFEHLARFTQYSFYAILIFHLDNSYFPDIWHMVATGMGVTGLVLMMIGWFPTWSYAWWLVMTFTVLCTMVLLGGFLFKWWEVGYGEYALALMGFVFQRKMMT